MPTFINPIPNSYLTSKFGWRNVNRYDGKGVVKDWHQGIDLSHKPNNDVKVLASANGVVYRAETLGTYGKVVMIRHTINNKRMDTVYAHLASYNVKVGQTVEQGQVIGIMGKTGGNWGIHLHYEIHNGQWSTGQPNAIDPLTQFKLTDKLEEDIPVEKYNELKKLIESQAKEIKDLKAELGKKLDSPSTSSTPSTWAKDGWEWAKKEGLMDGSNPHFPLTREQYATVELRKAKKK